MSRRNAVNLLLTNKTMSELATSFEGTLRNHVARVRRNHAARIFYETYVKRVVESNAVGGGAN